MKNFLAILLCILVSKSSFGQDNELAELLVGIGDSVKQATLNPIEKYNKFKPFERSYTAYSHPISISSDSPLIDGRVSLFHSIGFYLSIPLSTQENLVSNVSYEEIQSSEAIATLQGQGFQSSTFLDSSMKMVCWDYGVILAPIKNNPIGKNVFISIGITSSRVSTFHKYSNNGLLDLTDDFITLDRYEIRRGVDVGVSYVLPYIQASAGYKLKGIQSGPYINAGLNIPIGVTLEKIKSINDFNKRLEQLDHEAEIFYRSNF